MAQERRRQSGANAPTRSDRADDSAPVRPDEETIRQRAYNRFQERGGEHGQDMDDWLEAERDLTVPRRS